MEIKISNGGFQAGKKPFFVYSGEMHYFRIPRRLWGVHLKKAKKAGLNAVSTYIPWCIHERNEGEFDFKSISDFIKEVEKHGLHLIARVGPVSNAEMVLEGLPVWLIEKYKNSFLKGKDLGNLPHVTLVAYNSPAFIKCVEKWYSGLLPIISRNQIHKGGCISMVQLCNEIGMVHWLNKAADYNSYSDDMYRDFLKGKYGDIKSLNSRYGTAYPGFSDVNQPSDINIKEGENMLPYFDWMYYYFEYYAQYFSRLNGLALEHDISVPVIANIPQFYDYDVRGRGIFSPMTSLMFSRFRDYVKEVVFGGAYQMRRLDYENFHDVYITSEVVKMITTKGVPSMCCELQFGIMRDRPKLYPQDVELNLKTSAASGLDALNGYMFSGGVNEEYFGAMGINHGWQAPLTPDGRENPHYAPIAEFGKIIKSFGSEIAQSKKSDDLAIGFYKPYYATEYLSGSFIDKLEYFRTQLFFDGLARMITLAGYTYVFVDIQDASPEELKKYRHIAVLSFDFMDGATQKKLAEYVKSGGRLILYPEVPVKDITGEKEESLAREFALEVSGKADGKFVYIDGKQTLVNSSIQVLKNRGKGTAMGYSENRQLCSVINTCGEGKVLVMGFGLNHTFDNQVDRVGYLLDRFGVRKTVETMPGSEVSAVVRKKDESGFLFLTNYHQVPKATWLKLRLPGEKTVTRIPSRGTMKMPVRVSFIIPLNVRVSDDLKIRYSTHEVTGYSRSAKGVRLDLRRMNEGADVEIGLESSRKPSSVRIEGKSIKYEYNAKKGMITLRFCLEPGRSKLNINIK
ncbi:MAG: beta-galactosidase [Elusimicrobia bacterium]|nr:beta-galactosidase [Elusimicrobiota bacterium]